LAAALDHPDEAGYVAHHTHTHTRVYDELSGILASANVALAATKCDVCFEEVRGVDVCDCIEVVVAVEAYDMIVGLLLNKSELTRAGTPRRFVFAPTWRGGTHRLT
jgi:hypothetical protein